MSEKKIVIPFVIFVGMESDRVKRIAMMEEESLGVMDVKKDA